MELSSRRTPLSYAAWKHSPEIVKLLLAAQADPNGGTVDSPLLVAIKRKDVASTELLLQAGANPNLAGNIDRFDDLSGYFENHHDHLTPLWLAIYEDDFPTVQLLLKYKADPDDSQTEGYSLLFDTLADTNILEALLDAGAKVDPHRSGGWTPLYQAVSNRGTALAAIKILLDHGANPNVSDDNGYTALYHASALLDGSNVIAMLLDYKADPNLRSAVGETPLSMLKRYAAISNYNPESRAAAALLADLLRQHGALDNLPDWDHITLTRPAINFSKAIFTKNTNDWNHFTLLELMILAYDPSDTYLFFPDLAHLTIMRPQPDSTNETRIEVNLLNSTNGIDCARDVPLQFGDVVEIPEYNHSLASPYIGVTHEQFITMVNYLTGKVELVTQGQKVELPFHFYNGGSRIGDVLSQIAARSVLEISSDLSRVKVTRRNPQTGQTQSWVLNCSDLAHAPDLRVQDGDVIEVPEKPE